MFTVDLNADINGTCLKGYVTANYSQLVKLLGEPTDSDEYKVSGEWILVDDQGNVVTLYDWKSTNLYDSDYPTVEAFRCKSHAEFNIGAHNQEVADRFWNWINNQLQLSA